MTSMDIFVTGGTGFLGEHFLQLVVREQVRSITCLTRHPISADGMAHNSSVKFVQGDISDREVIAPYLQQCDVLVHMAGATGQGGAEEFFRVNTKGTEILVEECHKAGVKKMLFVSSIAVTFQHKHNYYYAQSKEQAEALIQKSEMHYSIVRPTIIIGPNGKAWEGLAKFAKTPFLFIPGDGKVQIQPIYVEDLGQCLMRIIRDDLFNNETYELGGPDVITMREFLEKVYRAYHGKSPTIRIPIPVLPIQTILSLLERLVGNVLPVSAGQLSSFRNDGIARENVVSRSWHNRMKSVDDMIGLSIGSC